jgi:hypothetical protein
VSDGKSSRLCCNFVEQKIKAKKAEAAAALKAIPIEAVNKLYAAMQVIETIKEGPLEDWMNRCGLNVVVAESPKPDFDNLAVNLALQSRPLPTAEEVQAERRDSLARTQVLCVR